MRITILSIAFVLALNHAARTTAREELWKAGLASVDITPTEPIWLAGYAARTHPSEGAVHPIYAKALALEDSRKNRLVIVTSDLLGFTRALSEPIARKLEQRFKLRRDQVLFTSSHTHTAPVVREYMVFAYGLTPEQEAAIERYSRMLEDRVVEVVHRALKDMAPARLSFGRGEAGFGVNRRVGGSKGYVIDVNRAGPVDHEVQVLRIEGKYGRLRGGVFCFS